MTTARARVRPEISLRLRESLHGYAFILIWVVGFALFTFLPLIQTFHYSLNQVTVTATHIDLNFVEWANYSRALFTDPNFVELLIGYTVETLVSVPIVLSGRVFSLTVAAPIHRIENIMYETARLVHDVIGEHLGASFLATEVKGLATPPANRP